MRRVWNEEKDDIMRRLYPTALLPSLAFRLGVTLKAVTSRAKVLGLHRAGNHRNWTDDELSYLREHYATMTAGEIGKVLKKSTYTIYDKAFVLHLVKEKGFMAKLGRLGTQHPKAVAARWKKGNVPPNKGKKIEEYMSPDGLERSKKTRFQRGHVPKCTRPIGYERIDKDGYIYIKVAEHQRMVRKHRWVWEQTNGPIPKGYLISFKDGDKHNCTIENLQLLSRFENGRRIMGCEDLKKRKERVEKTIETRKRNNRLDKLRRWYGLNGC